MAPANAGILLDSPALNSLKRAQLVQLCKRHGVKASGKNTALVERLHRHAAGMFATPARPGLASDCDGEDEDRDDDSDDERMLGRENRDIDPDRTMQQHPSETWEIVMDNSDMVEEQYPGSVQSKTRLGPSGSNHSQMGEFGSTGSSKSKVMQVLANSLGLSRSASASSSLFTPTGNETNTNGLDRVASLTLVKEGTRTKVELSSPKKLNIFNNSDASSNFGIATSSPMRDSLAARSVPYDAIPPSKASQLPHIEPFAFSIGGAADTSLGSEDGLDLPVPGVGPLAGTGVEADGTALTGSGTIRLISTPFDSARLAQEGLDTEPPALVPVKPAFDLVPPTPSNPLKAWPLSPAKQGEERQLYPKLTIEDLEMSSSGVPTSPTPIDKNDLADLQNANRDALLSPPQPSTPFVFGSPNPRHSSSAGDFTHAASSVLAEMNARLGNAGTRALGSDILASGAVSGSKLSESDVLNYQFGGKDGLTSSGDKKLGGEGSVSSRFTALHERVFNKMEGIDDYAARRVAAVVAGPSKDKETTTTDLAPLPENRKRKSYVPAGTSIKRRSTQAHGSGSVTAITGAPRSKKPGMPGGFGDEDGEGGSNTSKSEAAPEREAKRTCVEADDGVGQTKRISIAPNGARRETKTQAQSEADRRHLALMKARRRSSRARIGVTPAAPAQKPKGRLGFLASAKSFVKSVWNHGAGNRPVSRSKPLPPAPQDSKATSTVGSSSKSADAPAAKPPKHPVSDAKKFVFIRQTSLMSRKVSGKAEPAQEAAASSSKTAESSTGNKAESKAPIPQTAPSNPPARKPSASSATFSTVARTRLCAPTASSLAKMNENARNKLNAPQYGASARPVTGKTRASAAAPSRIPTISPLMPRKKNHSTVAGATSPKSPISSSIPSIFSSPLVLPASPQARKAAEQGQSVNAITGAIVVAPAPDTGMPSLMAMADSLLTEVQEQDEAEEDLEEAQQDDVKGENGERDQDQPERVPSILRRPRISRSRIIAKLGAQRERVTSTAGADSGVRPPLRSGGGANANANANGGTGASNSNLKTQRSPAKKSLPAKTTGVRGAKTRVSAMTVTSPKGASAARMRKSAAAATSSSAVARRSVGTAKARASGAGTGNAVMLSAKKRVRESEYARRRSAKVPVAQLDFDPQEDVVNDDDMDIDE